MGAAGPEFTLGRPTRLERGIPPALEPTAGTVTHALPADLSAVREARTVVQQVLYAWQADDIQDDVVLVASELVANALRHGLQVDPPSDRLGVSPDSASGTPPPGVRISLVSTGSHVICAVTDPSQKPPVRRNVDPMAGSGRGLHLVESLSLCWGWTVLDGVPDSTAASGKSVWAIFPLALPRRRSQVVGAA